MTNIPDNHAELSYIMDLVTGHRAINTMGIQVSALPTVAELNTFFTTVEAGYDDHLNGGSNSVGMRAVVRIAGNLFEVETTAGGGLGTRAAAIAPPQVQGLIKKNSALIGREHSGRLFIPDIVEGNVGDLGTLLAAEITTLTAIRDAWLAADNTVPFGDFVILHNNPATAPTEITSMAVDGKVATLRRRYDR